jgi:hypothetical protein
VSSLVATKLTKFMERFAVTLTDLPIAGRGNFYNRAVAKSFLDNARAIAVNWHPYKLTNQARPRFVVTLTELPTAGRRLSGLLVRSLIRFTSRSHPVTREWSLR